MKRQQMILETRSVSETLNLRVLSVQPHRQRGVGADIAAQGDARLASQPQESRGRTVSSVYLSG